MASSAVKEYLDETTFHGLGSLVQPSSVGVKLLWIAVIIAAFTYCGIEIHKTFLDYSHRSETTKIETEKLKDLPSATICQRVTDHPGQRIEGSLNGDHFKGTCGGRLSKYNSASLKSFMKLVNLINYVYGEDSKSSEQLATLYEKTAGIQLNETDSISLESLAGKFGPMLNIMPNEFPNDACVIELINSVKSKNFSNMVLTSSDVVEMDVDYIIGKKNISRGTRSTAKTDNYGGICTTYHFNGQSAASNVLYKITGDMTGMVAVGLQLFLGDFKVTDYFGFNPASAPMFDTTIMATATKFTRHSNCSISTSESQYEAVNTCRNEKVFEFAKCCLCGNSSSKCSSAEALCCTELHLAAIARSQKFRNRWQACHESIYTFIQPCEETKYFASFGFEMKTQRDVGKFVVKMVITNTDSILVLKEIPLMTGSTVLGNVGGVLGLFVGGSMMSLIHIVLFCTDRLLRLCQQRCQPNVDAN